MRDWANLVGQEPTPFGELCEGIEFRPKDHHIGGRDAHGTLVAAVGWSIATVEVAGHGTFNVIGAGALYVRPELRDLQFAAAVMDRLVERTDALAPELLMLFCEPRLERLYRRMYDCETITDPVWVQQPSGPTLLPLRAMWRGSPLGRRSWPPGAVRLHGLPF